MTVNLLGILLSYFYASKHENKWRALQYLSLFAFIFISVPIVDSYLLYKQRITSFPILFNPETKLIDIASPSYDSKLSKELSNCGLKVEPSDLPWSGVALDFGYTDWTKFKYLRITLSNPNDQQLSLGFRLDDNGDNTDFDSRFNDTFALSPNQTLSIELPLSLIKRKVKNREFNLKSLERALIFPINSARPFCIGKIELK